MKNSPRRKYLSVIRWKIRGRFWKVYGEAIENHEEKENLCDIRGRAGITGMRMFLSGISSISAA